MKSSLITMTMLALSVHGSQQLRSELKALAHHELLYQASPTQSDLAQVGVLHIHNGGWGSHSLQLVLTENSLLIRGGSEYTDNAGQVQYCTLPADILLENIVKIEAKRGGATLLAIERLTKLHIEYKDEKGKHHTLDFISQDATQSNNEWYEGSERGSDLLHFAEVAQNAIYSRVVTGKGSVPIATAPESGSLDPGSDDGSEPVPTVAGLASAPVESSSAPISVVKKAQYDVQVVGTTRLYPTVVTSPASFDPSKLIIVWKESHGNNVVSFDDILAVNVKQRSLSFRPIDPNTIVEIHIGGPPEPKLYVLNLEVRNANGKKFSYFFVSDQAVCAGPASCREGADNGQDVLDLARAIKETVASHAEVIKRGATK